MVLCFVPDCNHVSETKTCKMFRFAKSPKRRRKWKSLIRRADRSPGKYERVCSCHFKEGDSKNLPELFSRNQVKRALFSSPNELSTPQKHGGAGTSFATADQCLTNIKQLPLDSDAQDVLKETEVFLPTEVSESAVCSEENNLCEVEQASVDSSAKCVSAVEENPFESEIASLKEEVIKLQLSVQDKDSELAAFKSDLENKAKEASKEFESVKRKNLILEAEIDMLRKSLKEAGATKRGFTISNIAGKPEDMSHYTGLPNIETFNLILGLFKDIELKYYSGWKVNALSQEDQLFLTLFKLRRNPSFRDLARRVDVSQGTVENIFYTWLSALHQLLFVGLMSEIPSRFKNAPSNPAAFKEFPNCRIVIDCTEIFAANPKKMSDQNDRYSNYKHRITYKALVGIAPNGTVTFVSKLYPGSASDKHIVQDCGTLEKLEAGDSILADKGFLIERDLPPGVTLNIPPFKSTPHLTREQIEETLKIAQPRVHVERAIRVIKTFQILDFIPGKCLPFATKVFQVCAALSNFKCPLIREVSNRMK